jgi:antibiotic biosynthesis monooxygenase (ABM) superfamily enzyme
MLLGKRNGGRRIRRRSFLKRRSVIGGNAMNGASLPSGITTKITIVPTAASAWAGWQSMFTRAAAAAQGFVSLEIIPAAAGALQWHVIQRFRSAETLELWRRSEQRERLISDLAPLRAESGGAPDEEMAPDFHSVSTVTEVITTTVAPGQEVAYQDWAQRAQAQQATFPGYMGTLVQAPLSPEISYWTTLVRFATPAQLEAWLGSPERADLLKGADPQVASWQSHRLTSPFAGWFPPTNDRPPPAAWKQTCLVLLVLFPVVMLEIRFLSPLLAGQHVAIATFIGNAISVSLVSWPLMKIAVFFLNWWLQPAPAQRWPMEVLGACTIVVLYLIELLTFMLLY